MFGEIKESRAATGKKVPWQSRGLNLSRVQTTLGWLTLSTYHILGASPCALHSSLVDGLGFETRSRWADASGQDMLECQGTIPQVCLSPGGNLIRCVSCQIANCEKKEGECHGCV